VLSSSVSLVSAAFAAAEAHNRHYSYCPGFDTGRILKAPFPLSYFILALLQNCCRRTGKFLDFARHGFGKGTYVLSESIPATRCEDGIPDTNAHQALAPILRLNCAYMICNVEKEVHTDTSVSILDMHRNPLSTAHPPRLSTYILRLMPQGMV
jgi:hypothetical protein